MNEWEEYGPNWPKDPGGEEECEPDDDMEKGAPHRGGLLDDEDEDEEDYEVIYPVEV